MIERVIIQNYRVFKDLDFCPNPFMNIIVGDNEAGKSTLMEAINMAISGHIHGRSLPEELSPYWFNIGIVDRFLNDRANNGHAIPPSILIEVYLSKDDEPQILRGKVNSQHIDCPGFAIEVELDPEYSAEFEEYMKSDSSLILPTEYYKVTWRGFNDKPLYRRPKELNALHVNSRTPYSSRQIDIYARQLLRDLVDGKEGATISVRYRQQRHELTLNLLAEINQKVQDQDGLLPGKLSLQLDQSSLSSWDKVVVPCIERLPFGYVGQGQQMLIKMALALNIGDNKSQFIFVEEPENHLSHTNLFHLLELIMGHTEGCQVFVTTHSSYVLNRMGIDNLQLLHRGTITCFGELEKDTVTYFKKQSGYDTLRIVLARRLVIVEGPSDEMIFKRAYFDQTNKTTEEDRIDVITQGTRNRRGLELCAALNRKVAVLRDNDNQKPEYWREKAKVYLMPGERQMFIGEVELGKTLEPQIVKANINAGKASLLKTILGCPDDKDLVDFMTDDKTGWAWAVAEAKDSIAYPRYIIEAIDFVGKM
jgi:hypothetical protein